MDNKRNYEYCSIHSMMYTMTGEDNEYSISLCTPDVFVSVDITEEAFTSFVDFTMPFDAMLNLYTCLCIKYGKVISNIDFID